MCHSMLNTASVLVRHILFQCRLAPGQNSKLLCEMPGIIKGLNKVQHVAIAQLCHHCNAMLRPQCTANRTP